jgi:hypothetical protein
MKRHPSRQTFLVALAVAVVVPYPVVARSQAAAHARDSAIPIVERIQRADYEGDRGALLRLFHELTPLRSSTQDPAFTSRVRYWQGFSLWRRALNGFNQAVPPVELEHDLELALEEFEAATGHDPGFVDATVGSISCLQNLTFLNRHDPARVRELVPRFVELFEESAATAAENPRLLWVTGASQWYSPEGSSLPEIVERQATALATYQRGLELARQQKGTVTDPLEPSWGEPELLMNLAWSQLNRATPDLSAARSYATQALALIPHWRYVGAILMPQIRAAEATQ